MEEFALCLNVNGFYLIFFQIRFIHVEGSWMIVEASTLSELNWMFHNTQVSVEKNTLDVTAYFFHYKADTSPCSPQNWNMVKTTASISRSDIKSVMIMLRWQVDSLPDCDSHIRVTVLVNNIHWLLQIQFIY